MDIDTLLLHTGNEIDENTGALSIPIFHASTYHQKDISCRQKYDYSRSGNPTRDAAEKAIAVIEGGHRAFAFASGMAAISSSVMAVVRSGDHIVITQDIYGGAYRFFTGFLNTFGVEYTFVNASDINAVESAVRKNTKAVYIETPSNPLLTITDIRQIAELSRSRNIVSLIDNTFMSPYYQQPIKLGIDISIHSATKFLGGHSDLLAGVAIASTEGLSKKLYAVQNTLGGVLSPNDSWLLMRGIKTLGARMTMQSEHAGIVAKWLSEQKWVKKVFYPGLADHENRDIHFSQAGSAGAVLSFDADSVERAHAILKNAKICAAAVSLGGVDSILSYPWIMSHGSMPAEYKNSVGITESLLRLSVGLESAKDIIEDIDQAKGV
jgi:cysteine-S-conjugate beta-lyase